VNDGRGLTVEMLHHAMKGATGGDTNMTLRAEDDTSAGDNLAFLKSKLIWDMGQDGKERVLDADGNGVMMGWEEPLSKSRVVGWVVAYSQCKSMSD
jgi:protein arginine N-methyltransferase 2